MNTIESLPELPQDLRDAGWRVHRLSSGPAVALVPGYVAVLRRGHAEPPHDEVAGAARTADAAVHAAVERVRSGMDASPRWAIERSGAR